MDTAEGPTSPVLGAMSSPKVTNKKPKQWRWAENDFPNRDIDYEVKIHKDEALPLIENWLKDNYERRTGVCTAKRGLYADYLSFCRDNCVETSNNSAFGKVFKKVFPGVETRRLGKRSSNMTFYHDFARKGTTAAGPSTMAAVSDAVTPLRRPKRSLKKRKERPMKGSPHDHGDDPEGEYDRETEPPRPKEPRHAFAPKHAPPPRLRGGAGPIDNGSSGEVKLENGASNGRPPHIWEDGELRLQPAQTQKLAVLMNYSDTYWREVWALSALNPACLESKTVTALFFTPPGSEPDVDPVLALSTYHALSVGAFLVGDLEAAEELFEQTRHQLGGVFDTTHYDVANALCGIAFWHRFACTNRKQLDERTIYYLNQCLQICRNLRDTNSDIYLTAMREWGYFVGYSEEWLKVIDEAERSKLVDGYTPAYTRHWAIDPKYILIHTNQKGLFNSVCREVESFYRLLLRYEREARRGATTGQQDGATVAAGCSGNDVPLENGGRRGVKAEAKWPSERPPPTTAAADDDLLRSWRHELYIQKSVVDDFTRKILQGEMRFLPLATSIIIHMTLMLHVRYFAAVGQVEMGRQAAAMLVKLLISLPKAFKAVLMSRMEGEMKEFMVMLETRWLSCFTRLLSEFKARFVQLASLKDGCAAQLAQRKRSAADDANADEPPPEYSTGQELEPTGREKEELLRYFLAGPVAGERSSHEAIAHSRVGERKWSDGNE